VKEGERIILLTPFVASLLTALPRRNEWVFSSPTSADGEIVEFLKPLRKAMEAAGLPVFALHYLSRSLELRANWHVKIEIWMLERAGIELWSEGLIPTTSVRESLRE
jgi:hypothetical protein